MVSPKFDMEALREGRAQPLDVFEDAITGWILKYASKLVDVNEPDAGMAVMSLVAAYPEAIECYATGKDSRNHSKRFFTNGMKRVFPELTGIVADDILDSICDDLRNGLYHASMLKGSVVLVPEGKAVEYLSEQQAFRVNPFEFFRRVQQHFTAYVERLRAAGADDDELMKFSQFWKLRYGVPEQPANTIPFAGSPANEIVTSTAAPIDYRRLVRKM